MNHNIPLGTFEWDLSKVEKQIIENRKQIEQYSAVLNTNKKALKEEKKAIEEFGNAIAIAQTTQKEARKELEKGTITQEQFNKTNTEATQIIEKAQEEVNKIAQAQAEHIKTIIDQENAIKSLKRENAELTKIHEGQTANVRESLTPYKELQKELEETKIRAKNMGAQLVQLRRDGKENTQEYKDLEEQWKKVSKQADDLNNDFKALDKAVGDNHRSVGDYKDAIVGASSEITQSFQNILNGNITGGVQQLAGSFGALRTAFMSLTTSMLSNPITATLVGVSAVVTGVGLAVKELWDYNTDQLPKIKLIENKFGDMGASADELRQKINALEETFGVAYDKIIGTVDSVSSSGLSTELEAVEGIMKGIVNTDNVDDFLAKLELGASKAKQTGISLDEVLNLTKALQGTAIDPSKIYDGLEKATNRLQMGIKDNTALIETFGEKFTTDLLRDVQSGKTTTVQALNTIKAKGEEMGLSIDKQAKLGEELFGKLGKTAGGYGEQMRLVAEAHKDQFADLTDLQKATAELVKAEVELQKAKDKALKSDTLIIFKKNLELFWVKAQAIWYGFVEWISKAIPYVDKITGASEVLSETWDAVTDYAKAWWEAISNLVDIFSDLFTIFQSNNSETKSYTKEVFKLFNPLTRAKALFQTLTSVINGISKALQSARVILSTFAITVSNVVPKIIDILSSLKNLEFKSALEKINNLSISKEIAKANAEAKKLIKTSKTAEGEKEEVKNETTTGGEPVGESGYEKTENGKKKSKAKDDAKKKVEEEARKAIELQKQKTQQSIELAKVELAEYIRLNAEKYKDEKRWTAERLKIQTEYYNNLKQKQLDLLNQEEKAKQQAVQIKIDEINKKKNLSNNEKEELINLKKELVIIEKQHAEERAKIEADIRAKIKADEEIFDTQQRDDKKTKQAIEFQQKLIDLEIQGNQEFEIKKTQAQQQYEEDLSDLEEKRQEGLISLENYEAQKKFIRDQYNQTIKDLNEQVAEAEMMNYEAVFSKAKDIFGEQTALGKAFAVAQATINTYLGATKALGAYAPPLGGIMAALTVASGMKSVHKIMSVQPPKAQRGMFIKGNSHAQGGVPILTPNGMIEAEGGEIIINKVSSYLFKDLLSEINVAGGGVKFAKGGVVGSQIPSVQRALKPLSQNITINDEAVNKIANAIYKGSQSGISDLSDNNRIMRGANF